MRRQGDRGRGAAADVGLTVDIFGGGQLGDDAARIQSVVSGDIDMDIQGASALSALYAPMGAVDGAFVFDDSEHMDRFFTTMPRPQSPRASSTRRASGSWRLEHRGAPVHGQQGDPNPRGPPGAEDAVPAVAAVPDERGGDGRQSSRGRLRRPVPRVQQGTAEGQENPLVNIKAINLAEVQDFVSLSSHQLSSNLVVIERRQVGNAERGAAGGPPGCRREGDGRGAQVRRRRREGDP